MDIGIGTGFESVLFQRLILDLLARHEFEKFLHIQRSLLFLVTLVTVPWRETAGALRSKWINSLESPEVQ